MEVLVENELYDEFRIVSGLVVKVSKYKRNTSVEYKTDKLNSSKYKRKVKGLSYVYQLKQDLEVDNGVVLGKGTYIYKFWTNRINVVEPVSNIEDMYVEVSCAGGAFGGYGSRGIEKMNMVISLLKERYGM